MDAQAWLDQEDVRNKEMIRQNGWYIQYVGGSQCSRPGCECADVGGPSFAYTVGLFGLGHPELLIFGVSPETAAGVLNALGEGVLGGHDVVPGQLIGFDKWPRRVIAEAVPNPGAIVFAASHYYQRPDEDSVPVLQLSYDDAKERFPWDDGFADAALQPRPGTFSA